MFYLLVNVSFAYLLPVTLYSLCFFLFYLQNVNFVQCYSVLCDLFPMTDSDLCHVIELVQCHTVISAKITYLEKIGKIRSHLPYIKLIVLN